VRNHSSIRSIRILIGIALVASGLIAAPNVVQADGFIPVPDRPVVVVNEAPGESSAAAIQPKYPDSGGAPTSGGIYSVTATVTTNATLAAFSTITMCWYKASAGTDTQCTSTPNPQNAFQMVWTEATAAATPNGITGFAVTGSNAYVNSDSQTPATGTAAYTDTAHSMTIKFSFRVSNAMLAGSDWAVKVTAVYDDTICNNPATVEAEPCPESYTAADRTGSDEVTGRHVAYWGEMRAQRESLAYGVIVPLATSSPQTASAFNFVTNAPSDFTMAATDFSYDPDGGGATPPDVVALTTGSPGLKRARLECRAADGQTNSETSFLPLEVADISLGATIVPTGETVNTEGTIICTLQFGSGAGFALKEYSNIVTLSIVQSPSGSTVTVSTVPALDTIQEAINVAESGDTVVVPAGTYVENLAINKRITLQCANVGKSAGATPATRVVETVIEGQATVSAAGVVIDGCNFLRPQSDRNLALKLVSSSGITGVVTVKNSILDHTWTADSGRSCGAGTFGTAAWRIFDSKFVNNRYGTSGTDGCSAGELYNSRAVWAEDAQRSIVRGNHFVNTGQAIYLTGPNADRSELINNLFTQPEGGVNGGIFMGVPKNVLIKGNSFGGNSAVYVDSSAGTIVENNLFSTNMSVWTASTTSSVTVRFNTILGKYPTPSFGAVYEGKTFFNLTANPVDARLNYWGSATGPGSLVGGTGSALVSTSPWIASYISAGSNPDIRYTTGFWPTGIIEGR